MNIVVIDEWLPFPVDNGKKLRSYHLIVPLAERHRITYVCPRTTDRQQDVAAAANLIAQGIEVFWIDRPVPKNSGPLFAPRLVANLISSDPYSVQRHASPKMLHSIASLSAQQNIDLWHVEWTPYVRNLPKKLPGPVIIDAHNIESLIWKRYWDEETHPAKSWFIRKQWQKFADFERKAFARADCVITTTKLDADLAQTDFGAIHVEVVNNGVDLARFDYVAEGRDPRQLLFLGSLDWRPNLDAVAILLDRIFPKIKSAAPDACLTIVGLNPPTWLTRKIDHISGVELHANVPDVRPYLQKSGALLVPLRIGGGSRIKILEAMACGCPVVSTSVGAEGLHVEPNRHYLLANQDQEFSTAVLRMIRNHATTRSMTADANRVVRDQYGWNMLSDKLETVWQEQIAKRELVTS